MIGYDTLNILVFLGLIFEDWMDLKSYWNNLIMFVMEKLNFDYMGLKDYGKLLRGKENLDV